MTRGRVRAYSPSIMSGWQHKGSFVIKFGSETDAAAGKFQGRIEHVGSGQTIRFDSLDQLTDFLRRVLKEVRDEFQQADTLAEEMSTNPNNSLEI
jgi:hypothetical protein